MKSKFEFMYSFVLYWAELFDDLHDDSTIIGGCCHCNKEVYTVVPIPSGKTITEIRVQIDPANQKFNARDMAICEGSNGSCTGDLVPVTFGGNNDERIFGVTLRLKLLNALTAAAAALSAGRSCSSL